MSLFFIDITHYFHAEKLSFWPLFHSGMSYTDWPPVTLLKLRVTCSFYDILSLPVPQPHWLIYTHVYFACLPFTKYIGERRDCPSTWPDVHYNSHFLASFAFDLAISFLCFFPSQNGFWQDQKTWRVLLLNAVLLLLFGRMFCLVSSFSWCLPRIVVE